MERSQVPDSPFLQSGVSWPLPTANSSDCPWPQGLLNRGLRELTWSHMSVTPPLSNRLRSPTAVQDTTAMRLLRNAGSHGSGSSEVRMLGNLVFSEGPGL